MLIRAGEVTRALDEARTLVDKWPDEAGAHAVLGRALAIKPDDVAALRAFDRALALAPDDLDTRFDRAELLRRMRRLEEAKQELERLLGQSPNNAKWIGTYAQVLAAEGNKTAALAQLDRAIELCGPLDWVLVDKAQLELSLGRAEAALDTLGQLLAIQPDHLGAQLALGWTLLALEEYSRSLEVAQRVVGQSPESGEAWLIYGRALIGSDRPDEALGALDRALEPGGDSVDPARVYQFRGKAQQQLGDSAEAIENYDRALELWPDDAQSLIGRGRCHMALGDNESAAADFDAGAQAAAGQGDRETQAWCLAYLGEVHRLRDELDQALVRLDQALEVMPQFAYALGTRGQVLLAQGHYPEAVDALRAAIAIDDDLQWARASLAESLRLRGKYDEALTEIDGVLGVAQESAWLLGTRGQILAALGRNEEALEAFERAWGHDPAAWLAHGYASALPRGAPEKVFDRAIGMLDDALLLEPRSRYLLATKAEVQRLAERPADALSTVDLYLAEGPADVGALGTKAHALVELARYEQAVELVDDLIEQGVADVFVRYARARALIALDRPGAALAEAVALLAVDPEDSLAHVLRSSSLQALGRHQDAIDAAAPALEAHLSAHAIVGVSARRLDEPQNEKAVRHLRLATESGTHTSESLLWRAELADALADLGNEDEAREERVAILEHVRTGVPRDADAATAAGWVLMRLDLTDEAISWLHEAEVLEPTNASVRFGLGLAVLLAGNGELALDQYADAAEGLRRLPDTERAEELAREALRELRRAGSPGRGELRRAGSTGRLSEDVVDSAAEIERTLTMLLDELTGVEAKGDAAQAQRG
jgi:tetratricopeptide (TPR) repeat protein